MIARKPYYLNSTGYVSFLFETEKEATVYREYCSMMGMTTDLESYSNNDYKKVVYVFADYREGGK